MGNMTSRYISSETALLFLVCSAGSTLLCACGDKASSDDTAADAGVVDAGTDGGDDAGEMDMVWQCAIQSGANPDFTPVIGCEEDFGIVAARPTDSSLPGARSVKTVIDRVDSNRLYFQNSNKYQIHYEFASEHLSGANGLPLIVDQASFNENYYAPQRRFLLGAVTYYEGPDKWVYEISPYDNASGEMIEAAYAAIAKAAYFGGVLYFHPSGQGPEAVAATLPPTIPVITTDELYDGIDYQPLNLGRSCGRLSFVAAEALETEYVGFRDIVVLDAVPNDISVTQGIITSEFQTPLSHVNVLSENRGTPNMALRGAFENETLRALEGEWVILDVGAFEYTIERTTKEVADECWQPPVPLGVPALDLSVTDLRNIEELIDPASAIPLKEQIAAAIPAFGGKASHYGGLAWIEEAHTPKAFAIPLYYYDLFMRENGFDGQVAALLADPDFESDPAIRDARLEALRNAMLEGNVNVELMEMLTQKLTAEYPNTRMRFRSSTNAEDLGDFTGAGLYTSRSGDPGDPEYPVEDALREVWSSIWYFRAFEEREYRGIEHEKVGMALLVHHSFPEEEANGVALTANPFDTSGLEPGFYVNVQVGDESVVQPETGITTDQFIYYYDMQGQPLVFIDHSNLVPSGTNVLTFQQTHDLGVALKAIHQFFGPAYGAAPGSNDWYAMDVEFKFDGEPGEEPALAVKQARPHPGR